MSFDNSKYCPKCQQTLSISNFRKHRGKKDGLNSWCKTCESIHHNIHRRNTDKRKKARYLHRRRYALNHPERIKAHNLINYAIYAGHYPPATNHRCVYCDKQAKEYHHPDYSKPFDIIPLCRNCHQQVHLARCSAPSSIEVR